MSDSSDDDRMVIVTDDENELDTPKAGAKTSAEATAEAGAITRPETSTVSAFNTAAVTGPNSGVFGGVGQVSNIFRPFDYNVPRAGPSWASEQSSFFSLNHALQTPPYAQLYAYQPESRSTSRSKKSSQSTRRGSGAPSTPSYEQPYPYHPGESSTSKSKNSSQTTGRGSGPPRTLPYNQLYAYHPGERSSSRGKKSSQTMRRGSIAPSTPSYEQPYPYHPGEGSTSKSKNSSQTTRRGSGLPSTLPYEQPYAYHPGDRSTSRGKKSSQTMRSGSGPPSTPSYEQPYAYHPGENSTSISNNSSQITSRAPGPSSNPSYEQPYPYHPGESSTSKSKNSRQTTRRGSGPPRRGGRRGGQLLKPHNPNDGQNRIQKGTRTTATNPTLYYPSQAMPSRAMHPLFIPFLDVPPLQPINHQNAEQPRFVRYPVIHQLHYQNNASSPEPQVRSHTTHTSTPNTAGTSPLIYINLPHLVITPAPHTPSPTHTVTMLPSFDSEGPLDLRVASRQEQPLYPTLVPISQTSGPSVRTTPCTHTVTSTTASVVFLLANQLGRFNIPELPQIDRHSEHSNCPEHVLNQPTVPRPQTPVDTLLEHQQVQLWPLDTYIATDVLEEAETTLCDTWFDLDSHSDSTAVSATVSSPPVSRQPPTILIVPPFPASPPTTSTRTNTTTTLTTTLPTTSTTPTTTSSPEVRTLLSKQNK